ncbi:thiol peroxidase [bacterium]|nr:thiol peroxidase [bacterium]
MAQINFKGSAIQTLGALPALGSKAPDAVLTGLDLNDYKISDYRGKKVVLNIYPSINTGVCAASVRRFNEEAAGLEDTVVLCISLDLPFAQKSFCGAEGIENVVMGSPLRPGNTFASDYGLTILEGIFAGLLSRAVVVLDAEGTVLYTEQVPEIAQEPDYNKALAVL